MARIRPYLGDWVQDEELYIGPARRMPTLASALLVSARQETGLSQAELAKRARVSRSAISAIEHGKRDPGLEYLQRLLLAAGLDLLTRLAPHDDHDDVLKKLSARLTPQQREARNASMREVVDEVRVAMKTARPLISA